jgi:signal transduction histidine kinase/CheY-like chemotaxis protein
MNVEDLSIVGRTVTGSPARDRSATRLARLEELMDALVAASTLQELAETVLGPGVAALGVDAAAVLICEGEHLVLCRGTGLSEAKLVALQAHGLAGATSIAQAARTGYPVFIGGEAAVPIAVAGHVYGSIGLWFGPKRHLDDEEQAHARLIGRQCGFALERERMRNELERTQQIARDAERRKDDFMALLGHELRNPLSPILTALYLMRIKGYEGEAEREVIERQVKHLVTLVDDLLDVSRLTRGKLALQKRPVELSRVLARAIELASPLYEQKRHQLSVEVPAEGLVVGVDEKRMAQVLANLLTNAAKYTDAGGRILVAARREGVEAVIRVRDNGVGIPDKLLNEVFDPFVQGERGMDRAGGGLGLGLALVQSLVGLHGGSVTACSDGPGRGSEFMVRLPLVGQVAARREPMPVPQPPAAKKAGSSRRVLVVDDNIDAVRMLAELLAAHGHEVRAAFDGPQALSLLDRFDPEVAILDIGLPVMDGYELAREMRLALGSRVTLIAVTGYGQEHDRKRAIEAGFCHHFVKPVDGPALLERVGLVRESVRA